MSKLIDIINFYYENDLNEIYSSKTIDRNKTLKYPIIKNENTSLNEIPKNSVQENNIQINKIESTFKAISELAKTYNNQNEQMNKNSKNNKFESISDILNKAKNDANKANSIDELKIAVNNFDGCNLKKMATNTVFGDGNVNAKIMVIGEAPGNDEDLQVIPFCGDSGEMLTSMLSAINLERKNDYFITNIIYWRPPGNRKPTDEEIIICRQFLERNIQLLNPKLIILVGSSAMNALITSDENISQQRGNFIEFEPVYLQEKTYCIPIFHPSFLMRQPSKKKLAWQDMLKIKKFIDNNYAI
jgi:DNA polymerase